MSIALKLLIGWLLLDAVIAGVLYLTKAGDRLRTYREPWHDEHESNWGIGA